jgi:hypothetical protein
VPDAFVVAAIRARRRGADPVPSSVLSLKELIMRRVLPIAALATSTVFAPSVAWSAPVAYFAGAVAQVDAAPPGNNNFNVDRDFSQQTQAAANARFDYAFGGQVNSSATATSDLQTGTVRVGSAMTISNLADGFVAQATGFVGDRYEHFSGTDPFVWQSGTTARFDIRMTGNSSVSGNVRDVFNAGLVFLMIYPTNSLDDSNVPFCGGFQSYFWSIGPSANRQTPCGGSFLGNLDGTVDRTIGVSFNHPGDFDWVFGVRVGGAMSANPNSTVTWVNDYLSTAELFYTPPEGVTSMRSGSGSVLSPAPTGTVPVPGALWLLGAGLLALGSVGRGRGARTRAG